MEIVINFNQDSGEFQIYESSTETLLLSDNLGEGFSNLNLYLQQNGKIQKSILEDTGIIYHFDSLTFQEMIKTNLSLMKRVSEIPSEFKNSMNKFPKVKPSQTTGTSNFEKGKFSSKGSGFGKSFGKFNNKNGKYKQY